MNDVQTRPHTAPAQRTIRFGDHWMRVGNISKDFFDFGYVRTIAEVRTSAAAAGFDAGMAEDTVTGLMLRGLLSSVVWNRLRTDVSVAEVAPRSAVWPVPADLFSALKATNWDWRGLDAAERDVFSRCLAEWQAHVDGLLPPRRPFDLFLREVEALARVATAHNEGQTYFGYNRCGDREVVMHMSSWPRAREAMLVLVQRRFSARQVGDNSLSVRDRSEQPYPEAVEA